MKSFYSFVFFISFCTVIIMQVITIAPSRDASVASILAKSPAGWDLALNTGLKSRLAHYDVKALLVTALEKRGSSTYEICWQFLLAGVGLMLFSAIGFVRERKIDRMRKDIEPA